MWIVLGPGQDWPHGDVGDRDGPAQQLAAAVVVAREMEFGHRHRFAVFHPSTEQDRLTGAATAAPAHHTYVQAGRSRRLVDRRVGPAGELLQRSVLADQRDKMAIWRIVKYLTHYEYFFVSCRGRRRVVWVETVQFGV